MMMHSLSEEAVELLVAHLFVNPRPFTAPSRPHVGLLRFLRLLSVADFAEEPIIIDFDGSINGELHASITQRFREHRDTLPPVYIASSHEHVRSIWTCEGPTVVELRRLGSTCFPLMYLIFTDNLHIAALATESHKTMTALLEDVLKGRVEAGSDAFHPLFRTPLEHFPLLLHCKPAHLPRVREGVDFTEQVDATRKRKFKNLEVNAPKIKSRNDVKADFDPVQLYLKEVRAHYGDIARVYHDTYGGDVIGVVWTPQVRMVSLCDIMISSLLDMHTAPVQACIQSGHDTRRCSRRCTEEEKRRFRRSTSTFPHSKLMHRRATSRSTRQPWWRTCCCSARGCWRQRNEKERILPARQYCRQHNVSRCRWPLLCVATVYRVLFSNPPLPARDV